jgi:hypothetical protein
MTQNSSDPAPGASPTSQTAAPTKPDQLAELAKPDWTPPHRPERKRPKPPEWKAWHTLSLLAIIGAIVLIGLLTPSTQIVWAWIGTLVLLAGFATVAGHGILGLWLGLLIDERNKMSLSRLQMILWTIVVLSGFLTAALWNIRSAGQVDVLAIAVPAQLWLLMGISTTSLIGSPLIRSTKMTEPVAIDAAQSQMIVEQERRTREELIRQGLTDDEIKKLGKIIIWKWPWDARLADLFQGEEIGNAGHLDLGKIQMFYFTLVLVLAYAVMLGAMFSGITHIGPEGKIITSAISGLPSLPDGMVALLGISNGGYLGNKVIPHTAGQ